MKPECVWFCFFHPDFYNQPSGLMEVKKKQQNPYSFHIFKKNIWIFSDVERSYVWKNKKRIPFHHSKECIFGFVSFSSSQKSDRKSQESFKVEAVILGVLFRPDLPENLSGFLALMSHVSLYNLRECLSFNIINVLNQSTCKFF